MNHAKIVTKQAPNCRENDHRLLSPAPRIVLKCLPQWDLWEEVYASLAAALPLKI
jgi:hypothetical protein